MKLIVKGNKGRMIPGAGNREPKGFWLVPDEVSVELARKLAAQQPDHFELEADKPKTAPKSDPVKLEEK